jgi:nucleoside-diphosphate-sugar epimerase
MNILVTGSSGFIGGHLVRELLNKGHKVAGLDIEVPAICPPGMNFHHCDIRMRDKLLACVQSLRPEAILHLAARTDLDEKVGLAEYSANTDGVANLIEAIRQCESVQTAVFTSSQLVCKVGYIPRHDADYAPTTVYGESKVFTEKITREGDGGGVPWCLVRPTTVWGPNMSAHFQRFFRLISKGVYFHIGNGPVYQPYIYVGNIVQMYCRMLELAGEEFHRKTLYFTEYEPQSLRHWTDALQRAMSAPPIRTLPRPVAELVARGGDFAERIGYETFPLTSFRLGNLVTEYCFDTQETERLCGPLPYTMEEGVAKTVNWLQADGIIA